MWKDFIAEKIELIIGEKPTFFRANENERKTNIRYSYEWHFNCHLQK